MGPTSVGRAVKSGIRWFLGLGEFDVGGDEEFARRLIPGEPGGDRIVRIVQAGTNGRRPQVRE